MRAVVQLVAHAAVSVAGAEIGRIGRGVLVLLGVGVEDTDEDARYIADKVVGLRIFQDDAGKMNRSLEEVDGAALLVSQFTLFGDARKGRRPSYIAAAPPDLAVPLYEAVCRRIEEAGRPVARGKFGAMMQVELLNDGPVTILLDSRRSF